MAERIFDIQGFSGGESDDPYRGAKDTFYQAESVDIRKDLSGIKLASTLTDTGWNIVGDVTCMVSLDTLGAGSGIVICTNIGRIYLDGTLITTLATGTSAHDRIRGIGSNVV